MDRTEKHVLIILNPAAAKGRARLMQSKIERKLASCGADFEFRLTERVWHAAELAEQAAADGVDVVVSAGGDGTANEVVNGLMRAREKGYSLPEMGLFPIGRGNDFAYVLDIPKGIDAFCRLLLTGRSRPVDIGRIAGGLYPDGRYFVNGIGVGFEPMVNMTASEFKRIGGVSSYILAMIKVLKNYPKAVDVRLTIDGKTREISTQQLSVCNGKRMGGAFLMGPDAVPDDGFLDLCYVNRPVSGSMILRLVGKFFRGTQKRHPYISADLIKRISIDSRDGGLVCHADGEMIAKDADHLELNICDGAIELIREMSI